MTTRLSGHFPIFGLVSFALKSLLGMQNNGAVKNLQFRPQSLGSNVRILLCQTWAIVKSLACVQTSPPPSEETSVHRLQKPGCDSFSEIRVRAVGHGSSCYRIVYFALFFLSRLIQTLINAATVVMIAIQMQLVGQIPRETSHAPVSQVSLEMAASVMV